MNKTYTIYVEQDKDINGNLIQSWSVYKQPKVQTKKLKSFKSLTIADEFLQKYQNENN